jgi:CubicO group peptidase (beta-lactamase class C family)
MCLLAVTLALTGLVATPLPAAAQTPPATTTAPAVTLEVRLERLAAEIERDRAAEHAPGVAVAVVRKGQLIFARGFGLADVARKAPVTPGTRFFIGSTTKAFTATVIGMLVDEGKMHWDDPVDQYLPYFKLAVKSDDPAARATLRDLLSHRTGFPRMSLLSQGAVMSSEEILRQASQAEPLSPFRQRFHYNNEQYLAAGWAAAAAAGHPWQALVRARILTPLGMTHTETSVSDLRGKSGVAHGYNWRQDTGTWADVSEAERGSINVLDRIAPAGAISSTALDMAKWLRFLLARGEWNGRQLIKAETLGETWTRQITMDQGMGYGMGWMLSEWHGQPLILHDGNVPGYTATVALLPDSQLGIVLLINQNNSQLGALAVNLVPKLLLGDAQAPEGQQVGDVAPYLGRYVANFATFSNEVFTVQERQGGLALNIPSQMVYALNPPDAQGLWQFALTDQINVSFRRNETGQIVALELHQAGMTFEAPREGIVEAPEIDLAKVQKYLGTYRSDTGLQIAAFIQHQRLAIRVMGAVVFDLRPPDAQGRWVVRANPQMSVTFEESDTGAVTGLRYQRPGDLPVIKLIAVPADMQPLPDIEALLTSAPGRQRDRLAGRTLRLTGTVRFPQAAVTGRVQTVTAGDDRLRTDIDLGRLGFLRTAINGNRGRVDGLSLSFMDLDASLVEQTRLLQLRVLAGDWRRYFDSVAVLRRDLLNGTPIYVVELRKKGLPNVTLQVDAKTGDVLEWATALITPALGSLPTIARFEDYRDVDGMRLPFRQIESNDQTGRTVYQFETIEPDVQVDDAMFVLRRPGEKPTSNTTPRTADAAPVPIRAPKAGTASYAARIEVSGQTIPLKTSITAAEDGDTWVVTQTAALPGMVVTDRTVLEKHSLALRSRTVNRGPVTIDLTVADGKISGHITGPQSTDLSATLDGVLFADGPAASLGLETLPLADGYTAVFKSFQMQPPGLRTVRLAVIGSEPVTVRAGTFQAFKVELTSPNDAGRTTYWVAKDSMRTVKAVTIGPQLNGGTFTAELE